MAKTSLSDLMKEHLEHKVEARQDLQLLSAQKMGEHTKQKLKKSRLCSLLSCGILRKIWITENSRGEAVTAATFQTMRDTLAE